MCLSCGCGHPNKRHHDSRHITLIDLEGAAHAAHIHVEQAAENILGGVEHALDHGDITKTLRDDVGCAVLKTVGERRYTLGLAYPANRPDVGKALDGFRDFAPPETLEQAAWSYLRKGGGVGLGHEDGTEGHGHVVESYIYRGPDWPQANGYTVKSGDWLLGVVWDDETWQAIKTDRIRGFSPQGAAHRRKPTPEALAALRS